MLHYKSFIKDKSGDWVVFVHGAGGSSAIWFKQIRNFSQYFNILLLDLRGHGASQNMPQKDFEADYSFKSISTDILEVLDHLKIEKAHFIGVSLGTIVIRQLADMAEQRIQSMIMVGAVTGLNFQSRFWVALGRIFRHVLPHMWLYRLFARVIMPASSQKESRSVFIQEAQRLARKEFLRWFKLTGELTGILKKFEMPAPNIPVLYIMGDRDYLFIDQVRKITRNTRHHILEIVEHCGHVVNIEKAEIFNNISIAFLKSARLSN